MLVSKHLREAQKDKKLTTSAKLRFVNTLIEYEIEAGKA